jgi:hypothetical protein
MLRERTQPVEGKEKLNGDNAYKELKNLGVKNITYTDYLPAFSTDISIPCMLDLAYSIKEVVDHYKENRVECIRGIIEDEDMADLREDPEMIEECKDELTRMMKFKPGVEIRFNIIPESDKRNKNKLKIPVFKIEGTFCIDVLTDD